MKYDYDDETDKELKEKVNKITMHEKDVDRATLKHHEHADLDKVSLRHHRHSDLRRLHAIDEGY